MKTGPVVLTKTKIGKLKYNYEMFQGKGKQNYFKNTIYQIIF